MIPTRNYNFGPLARAAALLGLTCLTPYIKVPYKGGYVAGYAVGRRRVGSLLVDDHPKNHDLYRTKVNGKQYTIAKISPIDKLTDWIKKLNSL